MNHYNVAIDPIKAVPSSCVTDDHIPNSRMVNSYMGPGDSHIAGHKEPDKFGAGEVITRQSGEDGWLSIYHQTMDSCNGLFKIRTPNLSFMEYSMDIKDGIAMHIGPHGVYGSSLRWKVCLHRNTMLLRFVSDHLTQKCLDHWKKCRKPTRGKRKNKFLCKCIDEKMICAYNKIPKIQV